jgi:hypothetical protein
MAHYGEMLGDAQVHYTQRPTAEAQSNIQQYGELLNAFEPGKEKMYQIFDDYFNHPTMVKIKDVQNYSMYMSKTYCLLSNECRYIVAFVQQDIMPIRTKESLSTLKWVSLQTRTLPDHHNLPSHGYQPKRDGPLNVLITRTNVTDEASTYSCQDFPVTVTLLHTKKGSNEYQDRGNIIAALETYNTIICLNGN